MTRGSQLGFFGRLSERTLGASVAWAGESAWRRGLLAALIACALILPGIAGLGPTDRDEARFAQATKQMLESGDFIDPRFQEDPRHKKPIGIYWLQAGGAALAGGAEAPIWAYRIPSAIAAILAVVATAWATRPLIGPRAAFVASAMTAGLILLSFEARTAKTDAALLACVVAAMGALARLWFARKDDPVERGFNIFVLWTAIAFGVLIKGPIILMPVVGAIIWMCVRDLSLSGVARLGWPWGLTWLLILAAPWYVAIGVKTEGAFFLDSLVGDLADKIATAKEAHGAPPGAYLLAFWGTFWPWTALAFAALPWAWRWRRAPETAFLFGWIVPTWIIFEMVSTKLPHYVLITYPALCAVVAIAILEGPAKPRGVFFWICAILWAIPALALPFAIGLGPLIFTGPTPSLAGATAALETLDWRGPVFAAAALLVLGAAWRWLLLGRWLGFIRASLVGAGLVYAGAYLTGLPGLQPLWISERMVELAAPHRACAAEAGASTTLAAVRYAEPSFVFLAGSDTRLINARQAADRLSTTPGAVVWVDVQREERFQSALAEQGITARAVAETSGWNYNRGKWTALTLYARADDPIQTACAGGEDTR